MSLRKLLAVLISVLVVALAFNACCRSADAQLVLVGTQSSVCGTGCCIGRDDAGRALILTAAHCACDGGEYRVHGRLKSYRATVLVKTDMTPNRNDWVADVALLAANDGGELPVQPLGTKVELNDATCINGFPDGDMNKLRQRTAMVIAVDADSITLSQPSLPGESGGPICNSRGQVIGVLSSTSKRDTLCTNIDAIRRVCGKFVGGPVKTLKSVELWHFSAPWCVPCQMMEPVVRRLKAAGMPIKDINTDTDPQTATKMGISAIPAFVIVKDGKPIDRIVGPSTEGMLRRMYERHAVVKADCARPESEAPPPPKEEPPLVPVPDPISTPAAGPQGPPGPPGPPGVKGDKGDTGPAGKDAASVDVSFLTIELNKLRKQIAELESRKPPAIPVELINADTGESIGSRVYQFDPQTGKYSPIKLSTKDRKVK